MDALVPGFGCGARAAVRRAALSAAAGVIGAVGFGFVVFAAFAAVRLLVGPELAALSNGIALPAFAVLLMRLAQRLYTQPQPVGVVAPDRPAPPADPAMLAVFTAAFVLGRRLADRWRG